MHHTKDKGDLGLIKVMCDLSEQGFKILTPFSEHLPFDLVAFSPISGKLYKVQVKYRKLSKGVVIVPLRTSFLSSEGSVVNRYKEGDFDVIAVYCPDIQSCAYLTSEYTKHLNNSATLRVEPPKVGVSGILSVEVKMFSDYSKFPLE